MEWPRLNAGAFSIEFEESAGEIAGDGEDCGDGKEGVGGVGGRLWP